MSTERKIKNVLDYLTTSARIACFYQDGKFLDWYYDALCLYIDVVWLNADDSDCLVEIASTAEIAQLQFIISRQ